MHDQASSVIAGICRPEEALARLGGYRDIYADTLSSFLKDDDNFFGRIGEQLEKGNLPEVRRLAHTLKGFAAMCGALSVAEVAALLENSCRPEGDRDLEPAYYSRLKREFALCHERLAEYLKP